MPTKLKESVSWPFAVGFALNFTWTSSVFFHSLLYTSAGHSFTFSSFYMASMAVLIVSLALMGVCSRAMAHSFSETGVLVVVGLILFAGTIAAANASDDSIQGMVCFWLGAVFTGIGSAYMLALWGWFLGSRAPHSATSICAAYALSAPLYFAFALLPTSITVTVVSVLPALSLWVFFRFGRSVPNVPNAPADESENAASIVKALRPDGAEDAGDNDGHDLVQMGFLPRISLAAVLLGVVLALMNYMPAGEGPSNTQFAFFFLLATEVPLIGFLLYFQVYKGKSTFQDRFLLMYRTAVLVMMGAVLLSVAMTERNMAFQIVALAGYICLKSVFWSLFAVISRNSKVSPVVVFCFGEGSLTAGLFIGNQLNGFLGMQYASAIAAIAVISRNSKVSPVVVFCFGEGSLTAGLFIGNQLNGFLGMQYASAIAAITLAILLFAYMFVLNERRVIAITNEPDDEGEPTRQRFRDRCDQIAATYKLSRRETEVFYLFARGRSSSRIADDFYISSGTASTHLRNIYRKLDVHSRQELLDLIENFGE